MKKISSYHETLWEIELNEKLGFGYVQIIDRSIYGLFGFLVKIMNYRSNQVRKKIIQEEFNNWDLLVNPLMAAGSIPKKGNCKWKKMGNYPLTEIDLQPPFFKTHNGENDDITKNTWFVYKSFGDDIDYNNGFNYEQVKHLTYPNPLIFLHSIHHRITMEWMKILGMDFENYHTTESDQEHIRTMKEQVKYSVPYSEVPIEIRGKVKL